MITNWITGLLVYAVIWWVTIFMVLPWGNAPIGGEDISKGQAPSAPARPRLLLKMGINTLVAGVVWLIVFFIMKNGLISFRT
jgi:predicted secreted protein